MPILLNILLKILFFKGIYMLSDEKYVRDSLELNLFFLRIMKEHMIFLGGSFTPRDMNYTIIAEGLKSKLEEIFRVVIKLSNGLISQDVKSSGELVTNYTLNAEKMTEFYTGSHISTDITNMELGLIKQPLSNIDITEKLLRNVNSVNNSIIDLIEQVINFKKKIYENVLSCKMFTLNYPLLIDHILREAKFYLKNLKRLQMKEEINIGNQILSEEMFWNNIMEEHAEFIRGLLDPSEENLIKIADNFSKSFENLEKQGSNIHGSIKNLQTLTRESLEETKKIKDFKTQGTVGILDCKIKSIIIPLLADHVLREANHYLRLLNKFNSIKVV